MAIPVSKTIPLENPPETSVPAQEADFPEEASVQTTGDQANGVAATEEKTELTEGTELAATPDPQQPKTADPAGASADLPVPEEPVPSADTPIVSSEEPHAAAPTVEVQSQESVVAAEESASQEAEQISVEAKVPEDEPSAVAEEIPDDPKPSAPEDVIANGVTATDAPVTEVEESRNLCPDAAEDKVLPIKVNVNVATQKEDLEKKEAVTILPKAIQSKESSKRERPPHSTCHLSGWFVLISKHSPLPTFCRDHFNPLAALAMCHHCYRGDQARGRGQNAAVKSNSFQQSSENIQKVTKIFMSCSLGFICNCTCGCVCVSGIR